MTKKKSTSKIEAGWWKFESRTLSDVITLVMEGVNTKGTMCETKIEMSASLLVWLIDDGAKLIYKKRKEWNELAQSMKQSVVDQDK